MKTVTRAELDAARLHSCFYCAKLIANVLATGCGSKEFPQARVNELCEIYQRESRRNDGQPR